MNAIIKYKGDIQPSLSKWGVHLVQPIRSYRCAFLVGGILFFAIVIGNLTPTEVGTAAAVVMIIFFIPTVMFWIAYLLSTSPTTLPDNLK